MAGGKVTHRAVDGGAGCALIWPWKGTLLSNVKIPWKWLIRELVASEQAELGMWLDGNGICGMSYQALSSNSCTFKYTTTYWRKFFTWMNATTSPTIPTMCSLSTNHICTWSTQPDGYHMSWLPSCPQPAKKSGCTYFKPSDIFKLLLTPNTVKQSLWFVLHSFAPGILCDCRKISCKLKV
jgi:hypothetical protein